MISVEEVTVLPVNITTKDDETMDDFFTKLIAQAGAQLSGTAVVAQNNFVTVNKALDYDFMENRRMITLDEAVGVREVSSKEVPAGPANANK